MPLDPTGITEALGAAQAAYGIIKGINTDKKIKGLLAQRKSFQTPDEIFQILNATEQNAQGDTQTRDFQTNQLDRQFSQQLGTAELLGADPNSLSSLFDQKVQGIMQIGDQFHRSNMEAFGKYLGGLNTVAENKAAEQISKDNLIKDQLQALGQQRQDNTKNIGSGINAIIGGLAADETSSLYKEQNATTDALTKQIAALQQQIANMGKPKGVV